MHNGVLFRPIRVVAGVRQECILLPKLFLIVIDEVLAGTMDRVQNCELLWQPISLEHFNDLDFADEVVLLSQRGNDKLVNLAACSRSEEQCFQYQINGDQHGTRSQLCSRR